MKYPLKDRYRYLIDYFQEHNPEPASELHFVNPFQLLVAVVLSAQCTDKRVNMITPKLFESYPTPEKMAEASLDDIFRLIKSASYPNSKAKHLSTMAKMIVEKYHGEVPQTREELMALPGVGRKSANVVLSVCFGQPAMAVDTHVFRVANRLGIVTHATTPLEVEKQLVAQFPQELVGTAHHWLILHGRYVCLSRKPKCQECGLRPICDYAEENADS